MNGSHLLVKRARLTPMGLALLAALLVLVSLFASAQTVVAQSDLSATSKVVFFPLVVGGTQAVADQQAVTDPQLAITALVGGYDINGTVPDAGTSRFADPYGSVKELGPVNASNTKLLVINSAPLPMLEYTDVNTEVDLRNVWMDTNVDDSGNVWLYFAWERDSSVGSGVIQFEFQQAAASANCNNANVNMIDPPGTAGSPTTASLIATCNPWVGRQPGDFLIVWDQKGNTINIIKRTFGFVDNNPANGHWDGNIAEPLALDAGVTLSGSNVAAARGTTCPTSGQGGGTPTSADYCGEAAVNLTATVFPPISTSCFTVANIIPRTIIGNSDQADYKDTIFGDFFSPIVISNCGRVRVTKVTDPVQQIGIFPYTLARGNGSAIRYDDSTFVTGTLTEDGDFDRIHNLKIGTNYTLTENLSDPAWRLQTISCTTDGSTYDLFPGVQNFTVKASTLTTCTITNKLQMGTLTLVKVVDNLGETGPNHLGVRDFPLTIDGANTTSGTSVSVRAGDHTISETSRAGYTVGTWRCSDNTTGTARSASATVNVSGDENVTCEMMNTLIAAPALTLVKTASPAIYAAVGEAINYTYVVKNTGNVTLDGPVTVVDDKATVTCPAGGLAPLATMTCTASYTISQGDLDAGSVTNTAKASANGTDSNTDDETVTADKRPALSLVKTATPATYSAVGDVINYSYLVKNTGNVTLADPVTVVDDKATVTCPAGGLAPLATMTCTASYTISQGDLDAGSVTNTAKASANGTDSNTDDETVTADKRPALSLVKTATPATYSAVGDVINYSYLIKNTGNVTLDGPVTVVDDKATVTCPAGGLAPLATMTCTASYTISQGDLDAGSVTNTAKATANGTDSNTDDETVTADKRPALSLVKTATPATYSAVGDVINYSYLVKNTGNVTLDGPVTVVDDKATVTCPVGGLAPLATMICVASYTISQADLDAGSVTNIALATNGTVTSPTDTETITAQQNAVLTLVKTATPQTYSAVNQVISYDYLVTNSGNTTLSGPFTVNDDKATDENCPATTSLDPGTSITCTASYTVSQADLDAGSVTNIASATNGTVTSPTGTETVTAQQNTALTLVKTATPQTYSAVGQVITYKFVIENTGNVTLAGPFTVIGDKLGTLVACAAGPLAPSATVECTTTHTITQDDLNAGSITNTATATSAGVTSNQVQKTVDAIQNKALTLVKTALPVTYVSVGDIISYEYLVTNSGNVTLAGPVMVAGDRVTVTCPNVNTVGNLDSFLDPGESITCTASDTVTQADLNNGSVTNTASASAGGVDSNQAQKTVDAIQNKALTLVKTALPDTYDSVGDVISYAYRVTNSGNVTLAGPFTMVDDRLGTLTGCAAGPLAPSVTVECTATYTVTQDDLNAGSIANTATASANGVTSNLATATVTAIQNPKLTQTKVSVLDMSVVDPLDQIDPGDKINYIITAKNEGNVTLIGVTVVDPLLGTLSCTPTQPVTLLPGDSIVCTSSYTLLQSDVPLQQPLIRVCYDFAAACEKPVEGAEVFNRTTGKTYVTDARGYIPDGVVRLGDSLWARVVDQVEPQGTLYRTSGSPVSVDTTRIRSFTDVTAAEMRMVIGAGNPLLLYNLTVSAQWYLEDDPARVEWLRANLIKASDYLYDFSEGQFALGTVHVKQVYEGWDGANIKLHTSNMFHPNANVGGIVRQETADISPSITMSYMPGSIFIGSYWNRFGTPPNQINKYKGQVVPPAVMVNDWAIALAHEFGHYLLFLYDTYTDKNGNSDEAIAALCTGSAMGNAYELDNNAYIFSQPHWDNACGATEAHFRLNGRSEWDTIHAWYDWTVIPEVAVPGLFPPVPLTTVLFDPPANLPAPLASQVFSLTYQAGETSSGEARAFLFRDDSRVLNQGMLAKNSTIVELTDARVGDRLCVYDISDHIEESDTPRHQFGCEIISAGDSNLDLTRDTTWAPELRIVQTGAQQLSVTVNQAVTPSNAILRARLIREYGTAVATLDLTRNGTLWTGVFDLAEPASPVFLQLWVEEAPDAPQTRREVMTDRGTGGDGAFGPARLHSGVMAVSSDGNASYSSDTPLTLAPGESIAWQGMPGTPPLPAWTLISGQSYGLDAFPPELVAGGAIGIQYEDTTGVSSAAEGAAPAAIHFWDGVEWRPVATTITAPAGAADGILLASAPSQGVGAYAVLIDSTPAMFLPLIQR